MDNTENKLESFAKEINEIGSSLGQSAVTFQEAFAKLTEKVRVLSEQAQSASAYPAEDLSDEFAGIENAIESLKSSASLLGGILQKEVATPIEGTSGEVNFQPQEGVEGVGNVSPVEAVEAVEAEPVEEEKEEAPMVEEEQTEQEPQAESIEADPVAGQ